MITVRKNDNDPSGRPWSVRCDRNTNRILSVFRTYSWPDALRFAISHARWCDGQPVGGRFEDRRMRK